MRALYSLIPNYGIAIILLTILVRVVTIPLTNKQMRSMERMRALSPKLKEIKEEFADDRQKQSEKTMALYKSEGVNPLGGCLPMLLQFPVFIGLFYALRSTIQLRQAPFFGWIHPGRPPFSPGMTQALSRLRRRGFGLRPTCPRRCAMRNTCGLPQPGRAPTTCRAGSWSAVP